MRLWLFQQMVELSRSFDEVAAGLQGFARVPFFQRELIRHPLSDLEIAWGYANREFFDSFDKTIEDDARWAYKFQRALHEKLRNRDDNYLEVRSSEQRRKRKGLPPRAVILPDWGMTAEDRYDETQAKRKAKTTSKKRRAHAKAKGARQ